MFLDVRFSVSVPRSAQRGAGSPDPNAESNSRYVLGQQIYVRECNPSRVASIVIDNNDLSAPEIAD